MLNTLSTERRFRVLCKLFGLRGMLNTLSTEQNSKNEAEANFGATYLLAPTSLALVVGAYNLLIDPNIVVDVFDVSYPEAQIISRYFENRIKCNAEVKDYEEELNNRFCDSLQDRLNIYR